MDISKLSDSPIFSSNRPLLPADLFNRLSQLGSIEARVALIGKGQALLNTQIGQILSANTLDLKAGDRLQIRAGGDQQTPVIKIRQLPPKPIILNSAANRSLSHVLSDSKPATALLTEQKTASTTIQLGGQRISIPTRLGLKTGQLISLEKSADGAKIEIRPTNHQQVLKSTINQLLPYQAKAQQTSAITQLVRVIQNIVAANTLPTTDIGKSQNIIAQKNSLVPGTTHTPWSATNQLPASISTQSDSPESLNINFFTQLATLTASLPQLSNIDKSTIQQWLRHILGASHNKTDRAETTNNLYQLLKQFPKSETSVAQQLKQWAVSIQSVSGAHTEQTKKISMPEEVIQHLTREVTKLVEQSLGQQLLQQTNLRFQQELQQPIALNISIPLCDQNNAQNIQLKIRQRKSEAEPDKQSWDIHLNFELGLLGLISTHLLLDDSTLSVSFWSGKPETQQKIDSSLAEFKDQIIRAGFKPGQFHSFPGKPPETDERDELAMPDALLHIRV